MIKGLLLFALFVLPTVVYTQDFASRFRSEHEGDSALICVTISPKMMHDILNSSAEKDESMMEIIADLKSMQMCVANENGQLYYDSAMDVCEKNSSLFEPFLSYDEAEGNCKIMVRKKKEEVTELIMLMKQNEGFALINFTGAMDAEFISKLAEAFNSDKSL